jgi:hypothetical protein
LVKVKRAFLEMQAVIMRVVGNWYRKKSPNAFWQKVGWMIGEANRPPFTATYTWMEGKEWYNYKVTASPGSFVQTTKSVAVKNKNKKGYCVAFSFKVDLSTPPFDLFL